MILKTAINAVLLLIIIVAGLFLHRFGRPYPALLFNIHKLAALGMVVFTVVITVRFIRISGINDFLRIWVTGAGVSLLALFVSGGLMSVGKAHETMLWVHKTANLVFLAGVAGLFWTLFSGRG